MVTIEQAKQRIAQTQQEIQRAREQARAMETRVRLTKQQLLRRKASERAQIQARESQLRAQREQRLKQVAEAEKTFRKEVKPIQEQIRFAESEQKRIAQEETQFRIAKKYASRGKYPIGESKAIRKLYEKIRPGYKAQEDYIKQQKTLQELGLKAIYSKAGELKGFEDITKGMSYDIANITFVRPEVIPPLEKAKIISVTEVPQTTLTTTTGEKLVINSKTGKPYGTVEPMAPISEQWKKYTKREGYISGTFDFARDKAVSLYERREIEKARKDPSYSLSGLQKEKFVYGTGVRIIPYMTPGGSYILLGEGVENLFSVGGKERRENILISLTDEGIPKPVAKVVSYTEPAIKIGLGFFTSPLYPKTKGFIKSFGREQIPVERLVPKRVLSGEETFPTAQPSRHYQLFQDSPYRLPGTQQPGMYHATGDRFWSSQPVTITPGESELPGLYGSYAVSTHFLRTSGSGKFSVVDWFFPQGPTATSPGVMQVTPTKFQVNPAIRTSKGWIWSKPTTTGKAYIPKMKTEVEAILLPETELVKTAGKYYFKYKGVRVPIDEFAVSGAIPSISGVTTGTLGGLSSSYGGLGSSVQVSPGTYVSAGILTSYKPSSVTTQSYYPVTSSISKVTSLITSKTSVPSATSYKPSSKPVSSKISLKSSSLTSLSSRYKPSSYKKYGYPSYPYTPPPPPLKPKPKLIPKTPMISDKARKKKIKFQAEIRRRGKWLAIGKPTAEYGKALKRGAKEVEQTLAASFRIRKGEKLISPKIAYGFRLAKREPFVAIEKRRFRLKQPKEKFEIQRAKRKKAKGGRKLKWL